MNNLSLLILIFLIAPLINTLLIGLIHRSCNAKLLVTINLVFSLLAVVMSLYFVKQLCDNHGQEIIENLYVLGEFGNLKLQFGFLLNKLSLILLNLVTVFVLIIQIYHSNYMIRGTSYVSSSCILNFGIFGMQLLIIANNFFQLFCALQLLGLVAYFSIIQNFTTNNLNKIAVKSLFLHHLGDVCLLLAIAMIWKSYNNLDYMMVFSRLPNHHESLQMLVFCIVISSLAKSAQMPLHIWLPEAMKGLLPVTEVMHIVITCNAGFFMLIRLAHWLEFSSFWGNLILGIGSLSMILASLRACMETDVKKIIAYISIAQGGIILIAIGSAEYNLAWMYLLNHAVIQGLLIFSWRIICLISNTNSNILAMPLNIKNHSLIAYVGLLVACLCLIGSPLTFCFWIKNLLAINLKLSHLSMGKQAYNLLVLNNVVTGFYAARMFFLIFYPANNQTITRKIDAVPKNIVYMIALLIWLSLFFGVGFFMFDFKKILIEANFSNIRLVNQALFSGNWLEILHTYYRWSINNCNLCTCLGVGIAFITYIKKNPVIYKLNLKIQDNFLFLFKLVQEEYYIHAISDGLAEWGYKLVDFLKRSIAKISENQSFNRYMIKSVINLSKMVTRFHTADLSACILVSLSGAIFILLWFILIKH